MKKKSVLRLAMVALFATTAWTSQLPFAKGSYRFLGEFTVDGNNSRGNPLRITGLPIPCNVRITYSSGNFTNGGPMPGWGAYAGDCISVVADSGYIGSPFSSCRGPAGDYYYDLDELLSCLTNLRPFEFALDRGNWIEVYVWGYPGARCDTATRRCGEMSFMVEVMAHRPATYYVDGDATGAN
jgi:hypothetical protein